ncbi:beta-lactamase family protein [Flagellimonas sp. 389]|uniref:serine hydrolase domain-containing protein n=1 Tax=Flagellimonas sp. 389 TaxID=2835862 RepID=UPI001BD38AB1|nr:serine hydrolase domain-containing protein [Flagellimonas sp. 389]MBS9462899.1 beta-lactamase family protein [Flagellimonas sp. 389]
MSYNFSQNGYSNGLRLLVLFSLMGIIWSCNQSTKKIAPENRVLNKELLGEICDSIYKAYNLPGLGIAVRFGEDEFVFSKGIADKRLSLPITDSTLFYMGSFSEVPMTLAMMQLVESGKVDLDIPFKEYIPYLDKDFEGVRPNIHHLLSHTSGIEDTSTSWDDISYEVDELEMTSKSIAGLPLLFAPGSKRTWCGYGFDILADIMQKTTEQKFEHLLDSLVFRPMKLEDATFEVRKLATNKLAKPQVKQNYLAYTYENANFYPYARENAGSHGFHSSLSDMLKFFKELIEVRDDSTHFDKEGLFKKQYQTSTDTYSAYGWQVLKIFNLYLYEHSWRHGGFSGSILIEPSNGFALVVVTNTISEFIPATFTYNFWKNIVEGEKMEIKPPYQIVMSKQINEGKTINEVLEGFELENNTKESVYTISPEILAGLHSNLVWEQKKESANVLKEYIREKHPKVYKLIEPPPID